MLYRYLFLFTFFFCSAISLNAQNEFDNWYFGNLGALNFASGNPVIVNNSAMLSWDNSSTMSDAAGNLLFYSNGMTVWNKNHQVMVNGNGLLGDTTGGQCATAVRQPGTNLYYLFTIDDQLSTPNNGLRYSIIDMSLDGGNGAIVAGSKNVLLLANNTEKIVPVRHSSGTSVWIVTHEWNTTNYYAYLLNSSGLQAPVVTSIGAIHDPPGNNGFGQLTATNDGSKIASALHVDGIIEIFDFDNTTGVISNPITISNYVNVLGLEFSPDGSKLYCTDLLEPEITQFDLSNYNQAAIVASATTIGNTVNSWGPYYGGYIMLGPDDRIYVVNTFSNQLGRINNPNALGLACNYIGNAVTMPVMIDAGLVTKIIETECTIALFDIGNDTAICAGQTIVLDASGSGAATYQWSDNSTNATYTVNAAGIYTVVATDVNGCTVSDTISVSVLPNNFTIDLGNDTTVCGGVNLVLSVNQPVVWSTGVTASSITINAPGTYWAAISNACVSTSDTIIIAQLQRPSVSLGPDHGICNGDSVLLAASTAAANYVWNTGATTQSIYASQTGTYILQVWDDPACIASDTVHVLSSEVIGFTLGNDTTVCGGEVILGVPINGATYVWQDNSTDSVYYVVYSGTYAVTVTSPCGTASDEIHINNYADECALNVPTAFTPNNDGINDKFGPIFRCPAEKMHIRIYNRWGELVYETDDVQGRWNGIYKGVNQPIGVFVYVIEYFNYCEQKLVQESGNFTLLR